MTNSEGRTAAKEHLYAVIRLDFYDDEQLVIPRDPAGWSAALEGWLPDEMAAKLLPPKRDGVGK